MWMQGPEVVVLEQGTPYGPCPQPRPFQMVCDLGASAVDPIDGVLTTRIEACSSTKNRYRYSKFGLQGCRLDSNIAPQDTTLRFSVVDSAGVETSVTRCVCNSQLHCFVFVNASTNVWALIVLSLSMRQPTHGPSSCCLCQCSDRRICLDLPTYWP